MAGVNVSLGAAPFVFTGVLLSFSFGPCLPKLGEIVCFCWNLSLACSMALDCLRWCPCVLLIAVLDLFGWDACLLLLGHGLLFSLGFLLFFWLRSLHFLCRVFAFFGCGPSILMIVYFR